MCKITYKEIQQCYGKSLHKLAAHNSMASNKNTHALPKDRQNAKMVMQAWIWAQLPTTKKIMCITLLKQQRQKTKFLHIYNFGTLTPLQTDQN